MDTESKLLAEAKAIPENAPIEPAVSTGSITATISGISALVLYFAPGLSGNKYVPIVAIVGAILIPLIQAVVTRKRVWSPASVQIVIDAAIQEMRRQKPNLDVRLRQTRKDLPPYSDTDPTMFS